MLVGSTVRTTLSPSIMAAKRQCLHFDQLSEKGLLRASTFFFFYSSGIVHHEHAPAGQIINKEYYLEVKKHFRDAMRRKLPEM